MSESGKLTLRCPDCNSHLVVDSDGKDLSALLDDLEQQKEQAEDIFSREMEALKDRDRLLEDKFAEALKRAEEEPDDEPPVRPFDLD